MAGVVRVPFGNLKRQYELERVRLDAAVKVVLESGWFILGEQLKRFETDFAAYCGCRFAVGVANGTDALQLALQACGVGGGDEVLTVPLTAVPTANAITSTGAKPAFVDVHPLTLNMDPAAVEARITPRTKALLPVHLYGQAADMNALLAIAKQHGLRVIEDACQAHGATVGNDKVGTLGDAGCFSFYPSKNLGAFGDGGAVVTNDAEIAERVRLLRNYGQTQRYHHQIPGINSRLDEMQAAILSAKLPLLEEWNQRRRQIADCYSTALRSTDIVTPFAASYGQHVFHLYVVRHPERDALQKHLAERGIETLIHYPIPVHLQQAYRDLDCPRGSFPRSEAAAAEILSLPIYPELTDEEVALVAQAVADFR